MPAVPPRRRKKSTGPKLPTWALVWIALTMVVLVAFLANKATIDQVLETTGFAEAVGGSEEPAEVVRNNTINLMDSPAPDSLPLDPGSQDDLLDQIEPEPALENPREEVPEPVPPPKIAADPTEAPAKATPVAKPETRNFKPYFVSVNGDGQINLAPGRREVPSTASPLSQAIHVLLEGPTPEELSRGYLSLIPEGTRLLSTRIQNSTAYLSFSDEFQFNTLGMEGYTAQLKQVVFTATEFPTVKAVQILIEGREREYLGSEAIPLNRPLDRTSFDR